MYDKEYANLFYRANKEKLLKKHKEYYQKNKDKILKRESERYHRDVEKSRARDREYYKNHKERISDMHKLAKERREMEAKFIT